MKSELEDFSEIRDLLAATVCYRSLLEDVAESYIDYSIDANVLSPDTIPHSETAFVRMREELPAWIE